MPVEAPDGTAARPHEPSVEDDFDLDGRVAARIEDFLCLYYINRCVHGFTSERN